MDFSRCVTPARDLYGSVTHHTRRSAESCTYCFFNSGHHGTLQDFSRPVTCLRCLYDGVNHHTKRPYLSYANLHLPPFSSTQISNL